MDLIKEISMENLSQLKFKELHKLSVQFKVNKRWAKKQDIINSLLAVKANTGDVEWQDSSIVFQKDLNSALGAEESDRRLTFNIQTPRPDVNSRETYEVTQSAMNLADLDIGNTDNADRRLTFDVPPKDMILVEARTTFEVSQPADMLLGKSDGCFGLVKTPIKCAGKLDFEQTLIVNTPMKIENISSKIKKLTIPSPKVLRRARDVQDANLRVSKKSINIKKPSKIAPKHVNFGTPNERRHTSGIGNVAKATLLINATERGQAQTPLPLRKSTRISPSTTRLLTKEEQNIPPNLGNTYNKPLRHRKSKTEDNSTVPKANKLKVNFLTPPAASKENKRPTLPIRKTPGRVPGGGKVEKMGGSPAGKDKPAGKMLSRIPKAKPVSVKPLTATKMPDFASIHKKQFAQMESIDEYQQKRTERARRLFPAGPTIQSGKTPVQTKADVKKTPNVFKFQASANLRKESEDPYNKTKNIAMASPLKSTTLQKELKKQAARPITRNKKEENRSWLQSVRTNKRFELQMKFRNIQE